MLSFARDLIVIERWGLCLAAWLFIVPCHTLLAEWTSWAYWKLCMHLNIYKRYEYGHFTCLCVLDYSWMSNLISSTLVMSQSSVLKQRRVACPSGPLEWFWNHCWPTARLYHSGKEYDSMNRSEKNALFVSQHYKSSLCQSRDKY